MSSRHRQRPTDESPEAPSWAAIASLFFANLTNGLRIGLITLLILGLGVLAWAILIPNLLLPLAGKCHQDEGIMDCHYRVQVEQEQLRRFEDCQRSCGRATGSNLCLEQCEYDYGMGKWQYAQTYTTSTGKRFVCPQGQTGYEDHGRGYCA